MDIVSVGDGARFCDLGDEILVASVLCFLDARSTARFAQCCRRHHSLERIHTQLIWERCVESQYGELHLPDGARSKDLAKKLWGGIGRYVGFATDRWTHNFEPYPMVLSMREQGSTTHSTLYWSSLRDSLTRLEVLRVDRAEDLLLDRLAFTEVEILQGRDILIPNPYAGCCFASIIIGVYPIGSFFLVRTEALVDGRLAHNKRDAFRLNPNCQLKGVMVFVQTDDANLSQVRTPGLEFDELNLGIVEELPMEQQIIGNVARLGPELVSLFRGRLWGQDWEADVCFAVNAVSENEAKSDVTIVPVTPKQRNLDDEEATHETTFRNFSEDIVIDCWFVGNNCLAGLIRNMDDQCCGSLIFQVNGERNQLHKLISRRLGSHKDE